MFLWWPRRSAPFYFLSCLLLLVLFLISADTSRCFPAEEMRFTRPGGGERVHFRLSPGLSPWTGGVVRNFNWNWKNVQILHLKYEYKHKTNKKKYSRSGYNKTFVMWLCKISYLTLFWKEAQTPSRLTSSPQISGGNKAYFMVLEMRPPVYMC